MQKFSHKILTLWIPNSWNIDLLLYPICQNLFLSFLWTSFRYELLFYIQGPFSSFEVRSSVSVTANTVYYYWSDSKGNKGKMCFQCSCYFLSVDQNKSHVVLNGIRGNASKRATFSKPPHIRIFLPSRITMPHDHPHSCEEIKSTIQMNGLWPF